MERKACLKALSEVAVLLTVMLVTHTVDDAKRSDDFVRPIGRCVLRGFRARTQFLAAA